MKIYETRTAPNPRRVRVFLAEKGITVPFHEIDLMKGELRSPEYTKLNPFQRVPLLILDDGTAIAETMAICRFFEEVNPLPALMGTGARERATIEMWNRRMEFGLMLYVGSAFRHGNPKMAHLEQPQIKEFGDSCGPKAIETLRLLDDELAGRRFIAGDSYSVADVTALCAIDFMRPARIQKPDGLQHLDRWHADVSGRPSAKA